MHARSRDIAAASLVTVLIVLDVYSVMTLAGLVRAYFYGPFYFLGGRLYADWAILGVPGGMFALAIMLAWIALITVGIVKLLRLRQCGVG